MTGRRHSVTGRSTGVLAGSRARKINGPPADEPWVWLPRGLLESFAWRALTENARRVIDRVLIEHMAHGGCENGALPVTYTDLADYGLRRNSIMPAVAECVALGLLEKTDGHRIGGEFRGQAQRFRIAWLPMASGEQPTARWTAFASIQEATEAAKLARAVGVDSRRVRVTPQDIESSLARETREMASAVSPARLENAG